MPGRCVCRFEYRTTCQESIKEKQGKREAPSLYAEKSDDFSASRLQNSAVERQILTSLFSCFSLTDSRTRYQIFETTGTASRHFPPSILRSWFLRSEGEVTYFGKELYQKNKGQKPDLGVGRKLHIRLDILAESAGLLRRFLEGPGRSAQTRYEHPESCSSLSDSHMCIVR